MHSAPKVAVITRTKDRPLFLKRAMKSVAAQTMADFVHVILNDGGNQSEVEQIIAQHSHKIHIIHRETSAGADKVLNEAIKSVESQYVAIHDDDDTWHPEFLENMSAKLDEGELCVVATADVVREKIEDNTLVEIERLRWYPDLKEISLYDQYRENYISAGLSMFSRKVYDAIGYYDESLPVAADWDFGIRFLEKYDAYYLKTEQALAFYHHRPDAKGVVGNSVFAGRDLHEYHINRLLNLYLRKDMEAGKIGRGYLMSKLKSEQKLSNDLCARLEKLESSLESKLQE